MLGRPVTSTSARRAHESSPRASSHFRILSMADFQQLSSSLAPLYRLERELGHGAMGTVFVADSEEGTRVALKVLSRDLVAMMTTPEAFIRAIGRAGRAQHQGLLPFAGAGTTPAGDLYYAMSLVEGPTARDRRSRRVARAKERPGGPRGRLGPDAAGGPARRTGEAPSGPPPSLDRRDPGEVRRPRRFRRSATARGRLSAPRRVPASKAPTRRWRRISIWHGARMPTS